MRIKIKKTPAAPTMPARISQEKAKKRKKKKKSTGIFVELLTVTSYLIGWGNNKMRQRR
jgi:hypothetical protein